MLTTAMLSQENRTMPL